MHAMHYAMLMHVAAKPSLCTCARPHTGRAGNQISLTHDHMSMTGGRVKNAQFVEQVASLFTKEEHVVVVRPFMLFIHSFLQQQQQQ
jgi:hypothetical protein